MYTYDRDPSVSARLARSARPYPNRFTAESPSAALGEAPVLQVVPPGPNIGDLVDYLDATVRARGTATVPTEKIRFLVQRLPRNINNWMRRLWKDPFQAFPTIRVTVELVQAGVSLTPIADYAKGNEFLFRDAMNEYLQRLLSNNKDPCTIDYVPAVGGLYLLGLKNGIEKDLGINGQLDALLKKSGATMSGQDAERYFWHVYATFPDRIRQFVIPRGHIVLDAFVFDKSTPTQIHMAKIDAIARHALDIAVKTDSGFTIELAGHTDDRGTEKYNSDLGNRRASEVKDALRKAIDSSPLAISSQIKIVTKSFGETRPLIKARTEPEHERNRRVEVLMPRLRPLCQRSSLRAVIRRALGLVGRLSDPEQVKRITCLLTKLREKGTDDRWAPPHLVLFVYNNPKPGAKGPFPLLRDQLSLAPVFGPQIPDVSILQSLEKIDREIIEGMGEVNKKIQLLSAAATGAIPMGWPKLMKAMDELRAWMHSRVQNNRSIYSCYRNV